MPAAHSPPWAVIPPSSVWKQILAPGTVEKAFVKGATPLSPLVGGLFFHPLVGGLFFHPLVRGAFLPPPRQGGFSSTPSSGGIAFTPLTRGDRGVAFTSRKGCPLYSLKRGLFQQPLLTRFDIHHSRQTLIPQSRLTRDDTPPSSRVGALARRIEGLTRPRR